MSKVTFIITTATPFHQSSIDKMFLISQNHIVLLPYVACNSNRDSGVPSDMEANFPSASIKFSNIRIGEIGSTFPGGG